LTLRALGTSSASLAQSKARSKKRSTTRSKTRYTPIDAL
jgi:hypothetical protein